MRAERLADGDQQRVQLGTRRGDVREAETVRRGKQFAQPRVGRHQDLHALVATQHDLVGVLGETGEDGGEEREREVWLSDHVEEDGDEVGTKQRLSHRVLELLAPSEDLRGRGVLLNDESEEDNGILSHCRVFMKQIALQDV